jgi:hypothetical protein
MADEDKQAPALAPASESMQALFNPKDPEMWNNFRRYSERATQGINKMPFVFGGGGDYANLAGKSPQDIMTQFGNMSWGSPSGGATGGNVSFSGSSPFGFSMPGGAASGDLYSGYGLFTGRDAFGNPIGNTPLTVDWSGNSQQIPAWATSQAANITGLSAYHQAGVNPPPGLIQTTNDIAMGLFTNPPPGGR